MTQLSRPYQIALVALALLVLVWFAALHARRPSSGGGSGSSPAVSSAPATPSAAAQAKAAAAPTHIYHGAAPGVEGLTRAIDKAHGAVALSQREAHRVETSEPSAPSSATASAPSAASHAAARTAAHPGATPAPVHGSSPVAKHAAAAPNMQAPVEHELRQGKTVLILLWNSHGSEDVAVHDALPAVQHAFGGRIAVHYASASQVGAFGTITHAVQVTQTPTLLIVNPHGHTTVLTGLNDAFAIQQAVAESRHS
ncbi:MAG TPA: hypothetical protein VNY31_07235 [Solirubrobacteraceae bacterium]|jgi:hypothetical protein|nr:hypothetical protein [Solirubrobacteraceae bacterium]